MNITKTRTTIKVVTEDITLPAFPAELDLCQVIWGANGACLKDKCATCLFSRPAPVGLRWGLLKEHLEVTE